MLGIAAPVVSTQQFPSPAFPPMPIGRRFYNPLTHQLLARGLFSFMIEPMNTYRREVGLPTLSAGKVIQILFSGQVPIVMHYSKHLMPAPTDWPANIQVVGMWPLAAPDDWTPPEALTTFLEQGDPPIYFGFGSMPVADPAKLGQIISEALRMTGLRGVLQSGWAGLAHENEHLVTIDDTPHDWLFPRMAAIVHHGGSGTTHSALSAGKPALIVPFVGDQPMWGRRLAELGVNVPPMRQKQLTPERLAEALRKLTQDKAMQQHAANLGATLRAEDGLGAACEFVQQ
jgi:sterol 3beta-glucosyltransferase